jgi:hypothetical protein
MERASERVCDSVERVNRQLVQFVRIDNISWPTRGPSVRRTIGSTTRSRVVLGTKAPANDAVPRRSAPSAVASDSACHAGGRGFESRRSRKSPCKLASFVAALGANDRRPTGSRSLRLPFADAWAVAPGGRTLALAVHRNPVNEPNSLNLVTLPSLRWRPGSVRLGADVSGLAWTSPHQVVALVGKFLCCPAPLRLVVVNLKSRRVAGQERISGTVLHIARSARGLVLLTGPTDAIGPASLVVAHPRGVRATRLPSIRAGEVPGGGGISQWRLPGLAVEPAGTEAYVADPDGQVAETQRRPAGVRQQSRRQRGAACL